MIVAKRNPIIISKPAKHHEKCNKYLAPFILKNYIKIDPKTLVTATSIIAAQKPENALFNASV